MSEIFLRKSKRSISRLIFHHFGESAPKGMTPSKVRHMHIVGRRWDDTGYHGIIMPDGLFCVARDIDKAGAHTWGFNKGSIGILIMAGSPEGGVTIPTDAQVETMKKVIAEQDEYYDSCDILGHRDLRPTHCPGFDVLHWISTGEFRG